MPYQPTTFQLPSGARCARVEATGAITAEDATGIIARFNPGGSFHGLSLLVDGQRMERMTSEARALFANRRNPPDSEWIALVLTNPVIRVTSNFILRMNGNSRRRLFSTEADAVRWLNERVRQ